MATSTTAELLSNTVCHTIIEFFLDASEFMITRDSGAVLRQQPSLRIAQVESGWLGECDFRMMYRVGSLDVTVMVGANGGARATVNWPGCGSTNALEAAAKMGEWMRVATSLAQLCGEFNARESAYASGMLNPEAHKALLAGVNAKLEVVRQLREEAYASRTK